MIAPAVSVRARPSSQSARIATSAAGIVASSSIADLRARRDRGSTCRETRATRARCRRSHRRASAAAASMPSKQRATSARASPSSARPGGSSGSERLVRRIEPMSTERTHVGAVATRADRDLRRASADVADGDGLARATVGRASSRRRSRAGPLPRPRAAAPGRPRQARAAEAAPRRSAACLPGLVTSTSISSAPRRRASVTKPATVSAVSSSFAGGIEPYRSTESPRPSSALRPQTASSASAI